MTAVFSWRRSTLPIVAVAAALLLRLPIGRAAPPSDEDVAAARAIVAPHRAVFDRPPRRTPSFHAVDGPIAGNGDVGLTLGGPPEAQRYWISKCDFWKAGPHFKQAGPSLIGGIDVRCAAMAGATYHVVQTLHEPVIASRFTRPGGPVVTIDARVVATTNLIVLEITAEGEPVELDIDLWTQPGYGSTTTTGRQAGIRWAGRGFGDADLLFPSAATVALATLPPAAADGDRFIIRPGAPLTVVAAVATNHESPEHRDRAVQMVAGLDAGRLATLRRGHDDWWRRFWARSFVAIDDDLVERHYYSSLYVMACCSRNPRFPPGLFGNWITMDRLAWSGDIHLNYNHQAPFWALYSSNRLELTDGYDAPLLDGLERFRRNAREFLDCRGAYADVAIGPKGLSCRFPDVAGLDSLYGDKATGTDYRALAGQPMFLGQKSNAVFAAMNMILRYRYTLDADYARRVYPFLIAVADFWEDYLEMEPGADGVGRYVVRDDCHGEVGPFNGKDWERGYGDFNPLVTLGMLRVFLEALIEISEALGRDADRHETWRQIREHLSDLPTVTEDGRRRFRACEGGRGAAADLVGVDYAMLHGLVYPATNIGLGSAGDELAMVRDEMRQWPEQIWLNHGNAVQTALICGARVGLEPEFLFATTRRVIEHRSRPNLWISAAGGGIETCSAIPGVINEMLLQSHGGVIRVFPVFPADRRASFHRLRTFGAFLVSASIDRGAVGDVLVESERGRPCVLMNPWPGRSVTVHRDGMPAEAASGDVLRLPTRAGEQIRLVAVEPSSDAREP